jgi:hypothetical protein
MRKVSTRPLGASDFLYSMFVKIVLYCDQLDLNPLVNKVIIIIKKKKEKLSKLDKKGKSNEATTSKDSLALVAMNQELGNGTRKDEFAEGTRRILETLWATYPCIGTMSRREWG